VTATQHIQQQQERKKEKEKNYYDVCARCLVFFAIEGMFHSDEEHHHNVDPRNELQQLHGSTRQSTSRFELVRHRTCGIDAVEFKSCCDHRSTKSCTYNSIAYVAVDESQHVSTFTPEDKWPI
jgi:hypothetical protein